MKFSILTLFPEMFTPFSFSIIKRSQDKKLVEINLVNIRDFSLDRHRSVDDHPYGGGVGMVMRVDVIDKTITNSKCQMLNVKCKERIILLDPRGKTYNQQMAKRLSKFDHLILVCGHYEGVDERVKKLVDESVSIGDYILTGGEIPAMVLVDSITRLIPGVLKKAEAIKNESFTSPLPSPNRRGDTRGEVFLEYPQYTKPQIYKKMSIPKVLLNGDHKKIEAWRKKQSEVLSKTNLETRHSELVSESCSLVSKHQNRY